MVEVAVAVAFGAAKTRDRHKLEADDAKRTSDREVAMLILFSVMLCSLSN